MVSCVRLTSTRFPANISYNRRHSIPSVWCPLEPLSGPRVFGHAQWGKDWMKVSSELAQDRRAWSASVRDVVNSIGDAGSTRPGWMPMQVQVSMMTPGAAVVACSRRLITGEALIGIAAHFCLLRHTCRSILWTLSSCTPWSTSFSSISWLGLFTHLFYSSFNLFWVVHW